MRFNGIDLQKLKIFINIGEVISILIFKLLFKKYSPCGKKNCRCAKDKKYWHGPYYIWTRKENGKTITKSLSKKQAEYCKNAIKNMKKLQRFIGKWKKVTLERMKMI